MKKRYVSIFIQSQSKSKEKLLDIAIWAKKYTPITALYAEQYIILDTTGADHLFGGEQKMLNGLSQRFLEQHLTAISSTPLSACAFAKFRPGSIIHPPKLAQELSNISIEGLMLEKNITSSLQDLGLENINDLSVVPRQQLFKRFGKHLIEQIDKLFGTIEDPLVPVKEKPIWITEKHLLEPTRTSNHLERVLDECLIELCGRLKTANLGVTELSLKLKNIDKSVNNFSVITTNPSNSASYLLKLTMLKLSTHKVFDGIETILLNATLVSHLREGGDPGKLHTSWIPACAEMTTKSDLSVLIDTVKNRLDLKSIYKILPRESHIPERSVMKDELISSPDLSSSPRRRESRQITNLQDSRPLMLYDVPKPISAIALLPDGAPKKIVWRQHTLRIIKADGPERIEQEWWSNNEEGARDYYRLEDERGHRFWIYRTGLVPKWFVHGIFA